MIAASLVLDIKQIRKVSPIHCFVAYKRQGDTPGKFAENGFLSGTRWGTKAIPLILGEWGFTMKKPQFSVVAPVFTLAGLVAGLADPCFLVEIVVPAVVEPT